MYANKSVSGLPTGSVTSSLDSMNINAFATGTDDVVGVGVGVDVVVGVTVDVAVGV
jgi:hypothetical protein